MLSPEVVPLGWLLSGVGVFVFLAGLALIAGRVLAGRLLDGVGAAARLWLSLTLGFSALTALVFAVGALHRFTVIVTAACLGLVTLAAVVVFAVRRDWRTQMVGDLRAATLGLARESPWMWAGVVLVFVPAFGAALAPEVRGDSLIYHISAALLYVIHAGHVEIRSSALTYMPQNQQLLYALALLFDGDTAARLLHLLCGMLLAAGCFATARLLGLSRRDGMAAALLLLTVPTWFYLATSTYVDLAVANYSLACVCCLLLMRRCGSNGWLALAAVMAGMAAGCKYTAGVVLAAPALVLAAAPACGEARCGRRLWRAAAFGVLSALLVSPWLIRNFVWTGNPVAPSFMRLLGPAGVPQSTLDWPDIQAGTPGLFARPPAWMSAVADMYMAFLDYGNFLPVLLPLALGIAAAVTRDWRAALAPETRLLLGFLALALLLGVPLGAVRRDSRYVMAHVAIAAVLIVFWWRLAADSAAEHGRLLRRGGGALLALAVCVWAVRSWVWFRDLDETALPPMSEASRAAYIRKQITGFDALAALSAHVGPGDGKVLGAA
jgi:4-amino-4-deoxy-L-arabinose transferase-like glycosyltransferase